ncbi:hypothetical protein HDF12_003206 [Edaphobacter lichenicola]|uniref:Uncharacterized protein n=2 Tax=Tunturiibacter TaxID=3154218 RepID=A0A7Y9NP57_9BACT|nr:hypothetical protein [Edaphobacter lichenicola]NYF52807.1 hypothetical protein [Edaphobacter lichenicola]
MQRPLQVRVSCRTGALRGWRSLREAYTGLGTKNTHGPPVGRHELLLATNGSTKRSGTQVTK